MSIFYYFAAEPIYAFMHSNPQVVRVGIPAFKLLAMFQIPLVVGTIYVHALRGAGTRVIPYGSTCSEFSSCGSRSLMDAVC